MEGAKGFELEAAASISSSALWFILGSSMRHWVKM
jgi:hypothetical protein